MLVFVPQLPKSNVDVGQYFCIVWSFDQRICSFAEYLKYAHGIISEYLDEELSKKLSQHLKLPEEQEQKKRKLSSPTKHTQEDKKPKKEQKESESGVKNGALDLTSTEKVIVVAQR